MGYSEVALKSSFSLKDFGQNFKFRMEFNKLHPDYFAPDGLILFCGGQGAGKTLSAVRYIDRLCKAYPKAILISNIALSLPNYHNKIIPFTSLDDVDLYSNGEYGIILFIDEIQILFSSLESANISPTVLQKISQQRKRRLHIVGTTQLFKRVSKAFREQCNQVVDCSSILGYIQRNSVIDFGTVAEDASGKLTEYKYKRHYYWFRAPRFFDMYDTYELVNRRSQNGLTKHR